MVLEEILEIFWEGVYWLNLAQGRDKWRDLVNAVMKLYVIHTVHVLTISTASNIALHGAPFMTYVNCQLLHVGLHTFVTFTP